MQDTESLIVDNPWWNRPELYANDNIRNTSRERALWIVVDAGIVMSPDLMRLAPDQVINKLITASVAQVAGILAIEVDVMITEVVQEWADMYHWPKYYDKVALMKRNPLPILRLSDPKAFIRKELEWVD
jgi:hypothetical protein